MARKPTVSLYDYTDTDGRVTSDVLTVLREDEIAARDYVSRISQFRPLAEAIEAGEYASAVHVLLYGTEGEAISCTEAAGLLLEEDDGFTGVELLKEAAAAFIVRHDCDVPALYVIDRREDAESIEDAEPVAGG
jgi:hypothetical protein